MNALDILLILIVALGTWAGWRRGFLAEFASLLVVVGAVVFALIVYRYPTEWATPFRQGVWVAPTAVVVTLLVAHLLLSWGTSRLLGRVPRLAHAHGANRALGVLPGGVRGLVHAAVASAILLSLPVGEPLDDAVRESRLASPMSRPTQWLEGRLAPIFDPAARAIVDRLTVRAGSTETVSLPFRVTSSNPRPDLEASMLEMVNKERAAAGLRPLRPDPEMTAVARAHAVDMFARGYFSHVTPDGVDPFERIRMARLRFVRAGENLALARSLQMAHDGLMDSPGHRANILRPEFGRLGIGVQDGGRRGLMITQNFRN